MKPLVIAGVALVLAGLSGTAALAQYASDPYDSPAYAAPPDSNTQSYQSYQYQSPAPAYNSNARSYQDYQNALSAYDAARNTAARQRDAYNRDSADYRANRTAYERRLREYYQARDAYDAEYGAGAYAAYYGPPSPWD
jgi:hypothetical protein